MICQFSRVFFENLIFGGFLDVMPNCETAIELELLYSKF